MDSSAVEMLTSEQLKEWKRISPINPTGSGLGKGVCPADGSKLKRFKGDFIPPKVNAKRCDRCGKWWFPSDSLFTYKPMPTAKVNYFQGWGIKAMMILLVVMGTAIGVRWLLQKQQAGIAASLNISEMSVTYAGYGDGLAVFKINQPVTEVRYQMSGSLLWQKVPVQGVNGYDVARFTGLVEGGHYIVSVLGKEYGFIAK